MIERKCTANRLDCPKAITSTGTTGTCCVLQTWCHNQLPQDLYPINQNDLKSCNCKRYEEEIKQLRGSLAGMLIDKKCEIEYPRLTPELQSIIESLVNTEYIIVSKEQLKSAYEKAMGESK